MAETIRSPHDVRDGRSVTDVDRLLDQLNGGDFHDQSASVSALYLHYKPVVLQYARRTRSTDPEGVTDVVLFDAFRRVAGMRRANDHTFRRYLFQAVKNHAIKERQRPLPVPLEIHDGLIEPASGFETDLIGSMEIVELIDQLPFDQRNVMIHRILHGRSGAETGEILGKTENAVFQLQHRASRRLHRILLAGAVLLVLVAAALVLVRQTSQHSLDSSPATQDQPVDRESNAVEGPDLRSSQISEIVDDPARWVYSPAPTIASSPPVDWNPADETGPQTIEATPADSVSTIPAAPATSVPAESPATTPETDPSTTSPPPLAVTAGDDFVGATVGQPVDFNVLTNDSPSIILGTVSLISGEVEGLSLSPSGRLSGTPSEVGVDTLIYRLTASNGTTDFGQITVTVE